MVCSLDLVEHHYSPYHSCLFVIVLHDRFQWSIPEPDQELIFVEPDAGELHPNESSVRDWKHRVYLG